MQTKPSMITDIFHAKGAMAARPNATLPRGAARMAGRDVHLLTRPTRDLPRQAHLADIPGEPLRPRAFTATYFDTGDYRLSCAGIILQRRVEGRKGLWQLALPRHPTGLDLEFSGGALLPPQAVRDLLMARLRGQELAPIAKLRTWRTGIRMREADRSVADILFDSVTLLDGRRVVRRFSDVHVELTGGGETTLTRIDAMLRSAGVDRGDGHPHVFQAIGLPLPEPPTPPSSSAPTIDHVRAGLRMQVEAILAHDPGTRLGTDLGELHDMRVATRRLRALLRAARPLLAPEWVEALRTEIAWLGEALGRVRDHDVLIFYFRSDAAELDPRERRSFERLVKRLDVEHAEGRAALLEALCSKRYLELLDRLEAAAKDPDGLILPPGVVSPTPPRDSFSLSQPQTRRDAPFPNTTISIRDIAAREFKKLRKAVLSLASEPSDPALHRIRIKVKRARYAAELAEVIIGKPATRFIQRARILQDLLGEHQDAVVAEDRVRRLVSRSRGSRTILAAGMIVERQRTRRLAARAAFQKSWMKLEKCGRKVWL